MADRKTAKATKDEAAVVDEIASWPAPYDAIGKRLHEVILETVPGLRPKMFYGGAGYGTGGPVLCFVRVDDGVMSLGITEKANMTVEDGATDKLVGSAWFVTELDDATQERVAAIVRRAVG